MKIRKIVLLLGVALDGGDCQHVLLSFSYLFCL